MAADLNSVFQAAQTYTILSRVEAMDQLYILDSVPTSKFYADHRALGELERLDNISINKQPAIWEQLFQWSFKISSFNIRSLNQHLEDFKADPIFQFSDVICLSETWLTSDIANESLEMIGYTLQLNSVGYGRGLATYYKNQKFTHSEDIKQQSMQLTKLKSADLDIISVYRSKNGSQVDLISHLRNLIEANKPSLVCGDFNICYLDESSNRFRDDMDGLGFVEYAQCATHSKGGHIDHMYIR